MHSDFVHHDALSASELRARLLGFAGEFVANARNFAGVDRIAMLGSLVTAKADPKDVDLLVTVTDGCDLAPLAKLGRRLTGQAQRLNHGAGVFLTSPSGAYLGRTCHWRICHPGVRSSCDAAHCGARPYLHDDVRDVTLSRSLIAAPPLELFPATVARIELPLDVATWLAETQATAG
jgi:predicted nucleotidyltransferase